MRLCGQTVTDGKLVFQENLFRSMVITVGEVWNRDHVRSVNAANAQIAKTKHIVQTNLMNQ